MRMHHIVAAMFAAAHSPGADALPLPDVGAEPEPKPRALPLIWGETIIISEIQATERALREMGRAANEVQIVGIDGTSEAHIPRPRPVITAEWLAAEQARLDRLYDRLSPADKAAIERAEARRTKRAAKRLGVRG